ncbi:protein phosphatase 1 regulatory subunit 36 isoform X3 [Emydura macquarii macquarii]|uniref:protein phosphatase 1 regulatory subunit 36 isoform X3 n=1 Tax=Emydura macquarii macquarii TaxID=1129001 RepID=UPI00352B0FFE
MWVLHSVCTEFFALSCPIALYLSECSLCMCYSSIPATDAREKLKKGKTIHFQEMGGKTLDRSTPSMFRDLFGARFPEKKISIHEEKSPRLSKRGQHECVTLDDVKYAALFLVQEDESYHIPSFTAIMRSKQLDEFLMALLFYLSYYLEKIALEKKPKSFMVNPSVLDKKELEETLAKLAGTKKHLAKVYCILILGLGMAEQHHMACGKRKTSAAQKDREFFECFYNFCTYVAWVVFRRKHFQEIQEEVGRLLRSDIFNSALREKNSPDLQKTDISADQRKVIFPYHRAITSIGAEPFQPAAAKACRTTQRLLLHPSKELGPRMLAAFLQGMAETYGALLISRGVCVSPM